MVPAFCAGLTRSPAYPAPQNLDSLRRCSGRKKPDEIWACLFWSTWAYRTGHEAYPPECLEGTFLEAQRFWVTSVARDLGWCDHDDPRWGGHTSPCSAHRLLS
jgi:hypothetical protein